jgi:hypothetical protein
MNFFMKYLIILKIEKYIKHFQILIIVFNSFSIRHLFYLKLIMFSNSYDIFMNDYNPLFGFLKKYK